MIKSMVALSLAVMTSALGGQLIAATGSSPADQKAAEQSFLTPRIDGRRLDIRYSTLRPSDPAMTAERFCRTQGYDAVVGYSIQPALATRMIGDLNDGFGPAGTLRGFYAIRCGGNTKPTVTAMR